MANLGLIGKSLKHSFSKSYFETKHGFNSINSVHRYENYELEDVFEIEGLLSRISVLEGFNVTIPFKTSILPFLDQITTTASEIGAVNVVKVKKSSNPKGHLLIGENTDHAAFTEALTPFLKQEYNQALILGTGGGSLAAAYSLKCLDIPFRKVSRNPGQENYLRYNELNAETLSDITIIINTTPLGTWPDVDECPPIPYNLLRSGMVAFDMVYNPIETKFLRLAKESGAKVTNGLKMLEIQAELSLKFWGIE
ncbi:MAG: shikimate dehydrogenase family protein [Bacteroidota bacterium]|jgi:shikimate dehydrogenase